MSVSGGIISLPISISDVKTAVGYNDNNFASLCRNAPIRKWAKYKPVKYAKRGALTASELKSTNYGIVNIPTWTRLDYMCAFLCADNRSAQPSGQWPECDQEAGRLSDEYFAYQRPTGGSYYYRMPDFNHYDGNAAAPIGRMSGTTISIQPDGKMRVNFQIGPQTTYGLSLDDLSYPGSQGTTIADMYFGIIMEQTQGNLGPKTWVGCQSNDGSFIKMSQAQQLGYWVDFSSVVTSDWAGKWKIYPIISKAPFDITSQPSQVQGGKLICPVADQSEQYTVSIQYAQINITSGYGYRDPNSQQKYVRIVLDLTNTENNSRSYAITIRLYNWRGEEQTDFTGGYQEGGIGAGASKSVFFDLYVASIWSSLANGSFTATCDIVNTGIKFKKQGFLGNTDLTDAPPR